MEKDVTRSFLPSRDVFTLYIIKVCCWLSILLENFIFLVDLIRSFGRENLFFVYYYLFSYRVIFVLTRTIDL